MKVSGGEKERVGKGGVEGRWREEGRGEGERGRGEEGREGDGEKGKEKGTDFLFQSDNLAFNGKV